MKKFFTVSLAVAGALLLVSGSAFAFHGGGVAHCDGCHSMHSGAASGPSLTAGSDASSTCLNCHNGAARYHVNSADGSNTNEGGDFHWVNDNGYTYIVRGNLQTVDHNNFGHNVVASDFGMAADANLATSPGGGFAAAGFGCEDCHDPHGQVNGGTANGSAPISVSGSYGDVPAAGTIAGNYRLLWDSAKVGFSEDAPIARASGYDGASVQYGDGMAGWCANCHGNFYSQSAAGGMHPTDVTPPLEYNSYVATGNFTGSVDTAYDPLVPIERGGVAASSELPDPDPTAADAAADDGVTGTSNVMCLSCHRAHASPFENALRWDYSSSEFIAETWTTAGGTVDPNGVPGDGDEISANLPVPAAAEYYKHGTEIDVTVAGTPFEGGYGEYQRSLCNKCHVQD